MKNLKNNHSYLYYSFDGKLVAEKVEGKRLLSFLYSNFLGKVLRKILNKKFVSKLFAIYQCSFLSKRKIKPFIKNHNINMDLFEQPKGGYSSFNDFFIRKLKPGRREIDYEENLIVSPADSKLFIIPNISSNKSFFIKNKNFNLESFLQNKKLAQEYKDGTLMIFRFAPYY